jgi:hypothetical protein
MPIRIEWHNAQETIRVWHFVGSWHWQEFFELYRHSIELVNQKNHPVTIILDFTHGHKFPQSIVTNFRNAIGKSSPNVQSVIVVGNQYIHILLKTLQTLVPPMRDKYHYVATFDEALALIARREASPSA